LALIAAASAGAGVSIGVGYVVETHTPIGDGQYTARDATIDGLMGAVGVGGVLKTANYGRRAYKYHKAVKRADAAGDKTVAIRSGIKYNDDVLVSGVRIARDDAAIRAGLHSAAMAGGEMIKHDDRKRTGQPTTIEFGGRKIVIHDPIVSTDLSSFSSTGGQSSSSSKVNRSPRQTSRSAKGARKSGGRAPTWCKIHKRYDYC
jgi:hypothetical protein